MTYNKQKKHTEKLYAFLNTTEDVRAEPAHPLTALDMQYSAAVLFVCRLVFALVGLVRLVGLVLIVLSILILVIHCNSPCV